jgi:hypothetical protein
MEATREKFAAALRVSINDTEKLIEETRKARVAWQTKDKEGS